MPKIWRAVAIFLARVFLTGFESFTILTLRVHATGVDVFYLHAVLLIVVIDSFSMHTQHRHIETCVRDFNRCLRVAKHVSQ